MKTARIFLLIALSSLAFTSAHAQYSTSSTGTILNKGPKVPDIKWNSQIPLNKTYGKLNDEQRAQLHAMYSSLAPGDEPPFPEEGLKPIFNAIKIAQRKHQSTGELDMAVTVGPDGVPTKAENLGKVSKPAMTEVAAQALMSTKYKPALCQGTPCTMQFRFVQKLKSAS
jgi:hypothetical protein